MLAKNISHPPKEGSNRSLPLSTLLVVSCQMYHAWNTHGTASEGCPGDDQATLHMELPHMCDQVALDG